MHEYKEFTASKPIEKLSAPDVVVIPLSQHIGAPCTATVKVGDTVDKGQIIGIVERGLGCPVHATVSGKVKEIKTVMTPSGRKLEERSLDLSFLDIKRISSALISLNERSHAHLSELE